MSDANWVGKAGRVVLLAALLAAAGCSDCSLNITTTGLVRGSIGVPYFAELSSECGGDVWFLDSGQLPPGIGLQDNGDVEGLPTTAGTFTFVVGVFDFGSGETAYKGLAITITPEEESARLERRIPGSLATG